MSLTYVIIALTALSSMVAFKNYEMYMKAMYSPYHVFHFKEYSRLFSHILVHKDTMHLFFNMMVLYFFGGMVEDSFVAYFGPIGRAAFLGLYLLGGLFASIPALLKHRDNDLYRAVGASGAVSAVLYSFIVWAPMHDVYFFLIPIGIPAWIFGILYLVAEYYMDKRGGSTIAHDAHYYGAIFGVVFTLLMIPQLGPIFIDTVQAYIVGKLG